MFEKIMKMKVRPSTVAVVAGLFGYLIGYGLSATILYWIITDVVALYSHQEILTAWAICAILIKAGVIWFFLLLKTIMVTAALKLQEKSLF